MNGTVQYGGGTPGPNREAGAAGWYLAGILGTVLLEAVLSRCPGAFGMSAETAALWAARLHGFNQGAGFLWAAAGMWGVVLSGWERSRYVFAGGVIALLSQLLFRRGLPVFYVWLARHYPGAAAVLSSGHWLAVLVNVLALFLVTGYVAYYLQKWLWRTAGWEEYVKRSQEKAALGAVHAPTANQQAGMQGVQQAAALSIPGVTVYPRRPPDPKALDRIVGLAEAKDLVMRAMQAAFDTTGRYAEYGLSPPGGILLYGPPGTGKTSFARACAEALGCTFYVVNASAILGSLVGYTERAIAYLFQHARANRPSVIFWDEIDAVARKRDGASLNRPSDLVLNVLLSEMDGFQSKGEKGVLVIGATNRIDVLDPAILRPGRFDYKVEVGLPDKDTRVRMLEFFLQGRKTAGVSRDILEELAAATEGWSPAELKALVDEAAWAAVEAGEPISPGFLRRVLERMRPAQLFSDF